MEANEHTWYESARAHGAQALYELQYVEYPQIIYTTTRREYFDIKASEYQVTFHRKSGMVFCSIWWNLKNFFDLKKDVTYACPLDVTNTFCCPYWNLGLKKYNKGVFISLKCNLFEKEVSFIFVPCVHDEPFIITAGIEEMPGMYSCMIPRDAVEMYTDLLAKSYFRLVCRVQLTEDDLENAHYLNPVCSCDNISNDLETMFISSDFCDTNLKGGDQGNEFPAHKSILSARCRYLSKLFKNKKNGENDFPVNVEVLNAAIIEALRYIYTGTTSILNVELAMSLYVLCKVLGLEKLHENCASFLSKNITVQDFLKIYSFSVIHKVKQVQEAASTFFSENRTEVLKVCYEDETMITPAWMKQEEYSKVDNEFRNLLILPSTDDSYSI